MKQIYLVFALVTSLFLSGCQGQLQETYNPELEQYLPVQVAEYYGDNHYYHETKSIESIDGKENVAKVHGEVKNNLIGVSKDNFVFDQVYTIVGDSLLLDNSGKYLNDSDYTSIKILELPIEEGHSWEYTATDENGKRVKGNATITGVTDTRIEIQYTYKNGDFEERVIEAGIGTSEFRKQYTYKGVTALTGYVINRDPIEASTDPVDNSPVEMTIETSEQYDAVKEVLVKEPIRQLIDAFNHAWTGYYNDDDDTIFTYVKKDSNAYNAIVNSLGLKGNFELNYIELKVLDQPDDTHLTVVEVYDYDGQRHYNKMQYEIDNIDGKWVITNYYTVY